MDWIKIPFTKKLTSQELDYLTSILLGYDRQLAAVAEFIGTDEYAELMYMNQRQIDAFFRNSGITQKLDQLIEFNASDSNTFIEEFYRIGAEAGYNDIAQTLAYTIADKEALYRVSRYNFNLVSNANTELRNGIREVIFNAVTEGDGYQTTMRRLMELPLEPVNGISPQTRAEMIARTEHARAVNTGTLQAYANYGVDQVDIITSHDGLVCDDCLDLEENNPYTLQEVQGLLPAHPNCRCYYVAVVPEPDLLTLQSNPVVVDLTA